MAEPSQIPLLALDDITVSVKDKVLIHGVSLALHKGEVVTLIGPNGAGKSTIVKVILGLLKPSSGKVARGVGLSIGYAPQAMALDSAMPLTVERFMSLSGRAKKAAVPQALGLVGAAGLAKCSMHDLSGGERQRVLLARAVLGAPDLLVLDEPAQGVDAQGQLDMYELIADIADKTGAGVLVVSHDLHLVMARTDRVICVNGHVCCEGTATEVANDPHYEALFGRRGAQDLAVYRHDHDHHH
ncbi:MAG: ATP-binding cassette domain-containing protein [Alphaproteobacteria bacterium]